MLAILLAACESATEPREDEPVDAPSNISIALTTGDPTDRIQVTSNPVGPSGQLSICLEVTSETGWWKGLGINRTDPTIEAEGQGSMKCTVAAPGVVDFTFWKAKVFGVHTNVGTHSLDLSRYAGYTIQFTWYAD